MTNQEIYNMNTYLIKCEYVSQIYREDDPSPMYHLVQGKTFEQAVEKLKDTEGELGNRLYAANWIFENMSII